MESIAVILLLTVLTVAVLLVLVIWSIRRHRFANSGYRLHSHN